MQLHSILADLWAALGPAGLLLGLAMGGLAVVGFMEQFGRRRASGLACLLVPMALWNLPFGPLSSNMDTLTLALGLLLLLRRPLPRHPGDPDAGGSRPRTGGPPRPRPDRHALTRDGSGPAGSSCSPDRSMHGGETAVAAEEGGDVSEARQPAGDHRRGRAHLPPDGSCCPVS